MSDHDEAASTLVFGLTGVSAWRASSAEARPSASMLAAAARRRATPLELVVAELAGGLLDLPPHDRVRVRMVLGSRFGELSATETILGSLTTGDGRVSPSAFSSSVHNASLGLVSIAAGIEAGSLAMSGGAATAHLCLVEAAALLREDDAPVIVLLADEAPSATLGQTGRFPLAGVALRLERATARRVAATTATMFVIPPRGDATRVQGHDDVARPIESDDPSPLESPAWWPLRPVFSDSSPTPIGAASDADESAQLQQRLAASSVVLTSGRRGRWDDVLVRFAPMDDVDGLAAAHAAVPHEPPARVVGFPAWWTEDGLVCTVSPRHGDPFVEPRVLDEAPKNEAAGIEEDEVARREDLVVDAIACLEWIAQAAAWCGAKSPQAGPLQRSERREGALLATRSLRLDRRWLVLGECYRVGVRCIAASEGLARYEGVVTCERGLRVASADVLVRSSAS